jgi:hypothetical protein
VKTSTSPLATLGSVTSFLAATPINQIMIGTTRSGISYIYCGMYTLKCRCYWNVVQYRWKVHNGKADIDLIWLKFSFSMNSHCQFKICFIRIKIQFGENGCYLYERSNKWNMKRRYLI